MNYYVIQDSAGKIIDIKQTSNPPPPPEWLPRGWIVKQIPKMLYDLITHEGPRDFMQNPKRSILRNMTGLVAINGD